jgi:hypothetical protein
MPHPRRVTLAYPLSLQATREVHVAESIYPAFASIRRWCELSGLGRSVVYVMLGDGRLRAVKAGNRTLIDVQAGLAYLNALPSATIRAPRNAA